MDECGRAIKSRKLLRYSAAVDAPRVGSGAL